jgi:hypothetical protein
MSSKTNYVGSTLAIGIFLYLANQVLKTNYVGSTLAIGIFLYLENQVFGNKLRWFDSCYRHISVSSQSGLRKQTTLVRVPLSAYFSM